MFGHVRGPWLQVGGVLTAVAFVGGMAALGGCGGSAGGSAGAAAGSARPSATASAVATATADPREAAVIAAAKNYIEAVNRAYVSGKADELHSLCVPGSLPDSMASDPEHSVMVTHGTFVVTMTRYDVVSTSLLTNSARVDMTYVLMGYHANWPALSQAGSAMALPQKVNQLDMQYENGQWLVDAIH